MARLPNIKKARERLRAGLSDQRAQRRAGGQKPSIRGEFLDRLKKRFIGDTSTGVKVGKRTSAVSVSRAPAVSNVSNAADITLPALVVPRIERPKTAATIQTLVSQMDALLRVAQSVGALSAQQQSLLIQQIKQAKAVTKEAQLEAAITAEPAAEMVQSEADVSITPLDDVMGKLTQTVNDLIDTINEKMKSKCDCQSLGLPVASGGMGNMRLPGPVTKQAPQTASGGTQPAAVKRGSFVRDPNDRRNRMAERGRRRKAGGQAPSIRGEFTRRLQTRMIGSGYAEQAKAVKAVARKQQQRATMQAAKQAGSPPTQARSPSLQIANVVSSSASKSGRNPIQAINETAVSKIASPIIKKALGSTALKSIPIVGLGVGGMMAASRLLEGDVVGAGLDVTSGLGGPLTAIPALAATVARDTYSGLFGIQPEQDPGFAPKMALITSMVGGLIKNMLSNKIEPQQKATDKEKKNLANPPINVNQTKKTSGTPPTLTPPKNPPPPPASTKQNNPPPSTNPPPATKATPAASTSGGPAAAPKAQAGAAPAATSGAAAPKGTEAISIPAAATGKQITPVPPAAGEAPGPSVSPMPAASVLKGADIVAESFKNEMEAAKSTVVGAAPRSQLAAQPSTDITTKSGASGMGNVPDPNFYDMGDAASQLYFTAAG